MSVSENNSVQNENQHVDMENSVGIFCGPPEELEEWFCLIISIVCLIVTALVVWFTINFASVKWHYYPAVLCAIITMISIIFTVIVFKYPQKASNSIVVDGVWITKDKVCIGKQEFEFSKACLIRDMYGRKCTSLINATRLSTEKGECIEKTEASVNIQIINSKHNTDDYRIARIHIFKGDDIIKTYDVRSSGAPVIVVNDQIYSCTIVKLVGQLKILAEGLKSIQGSEVSICNLSITPQSGVPRVVFVVGALGGLAKRISDSVKTSKAKKAFRDGEFIDKETSDFMLQLVEEYGWYIEFRRLEMNELGLLGGGW